MTVDEAFRIGRKALEEAGIDGAARDARWMMAHALGTKPDRLTLFLPDEIGRESEAIFADAVMRRVKREPVSHILGGREFYGRWFRISRQVLDPRPETETLVSLALAQPFEHVLDLGTGSGCLLLSLLAERDAATGLGVDTSEAALDLARVNMIELGLSNRAELRLSDWFAQVGGTYDLIVANPPYIAAQEMAGLAPEVRDHEPRAALTDEGDGLSAYLAISAAAGDFLAPDGRLIVEIGPTQGKAVAAMFGAAGLHDVQVLPDLDGRDRLVFARKGAA